MIGGDDIRRKLLPCICGSTPTIKLDDIQIDAYLLWVIRCSCGNGVMNCDVDWMIYKWNTERRFKTNQRKMWRSY